MRIFGSKSTATPSRLLLSGDYHNAKSALIDSDGKIYLVNQQTGIDQVIAEYPNVTTKYLLTENNFLVLSSADANDADARYFEIHKQFKISDTHIIREYVGDKYLVLSSLPNESHKLLTENNVSVGHLATAMLKSVQDQPDVFLVQIVGRNVVVFAKQDGKLLRLSSTDFDAKNDVLYDILWTIEQYNLPKDIAITITGDIYLSSDLYELLSEYLNLDVKTIPNQVLTSEFEDSQLLYDLYLCDQCV